MVTNHSFLPRPFLVLFFLLAILPFVSPWCYYTSFSTIANPTVIDYCRDNTRIVVTSNNNAFIFDPVIYALQHTVSFAPVNVRTARFTKDNKFLAVGLSNGSVVFLNGSPPYSNTVLHAVTP